MLKLKSLKEPTSKDDGLTIMIARYGIVKRAIFVVDLVDGRAPTSGVVFTEDVAKAAGQ